MDNNKIPSFNSKLNPEFKNTLDKLISKKRTFLKYLTFQWVCYIIALLIILTNLNSFSNSINTLKPITIFCIAGFFIIIANEILKKPKKDLEKAKQNVKDEMLFDICTCKNRCTCRTEIKKYINSKNIDLFKEEK